jgi:hypothetical protein
MKKILLTQGKEAIVSEEDFSKLNQFRWCAHKGPSNKYYAVTDLNINHQYAGKARVVTKKYKKLNGETVEYKRKKVFMHWMIIADSKNETDHINGNSLDNRRENLRLVTHNQNLMNKKKYKNNTSGFKGVYRCRDKWRAAISIGGKRTHIGSFSKIEDAVKTYNKMAVKVFGEYARLNTI